MQDISIYLILKYQMRVFYPHQTMMRDTSITMMRDTFVDLILKYQMRLIYPQNRVIYPNFSFIDFRSSPNQFFLSMFRKPMVQPDFSSQVDKFILKTGVVLFQVHQLLDFEDFLQFNVCLLTLKDISMKTIHNITQEWTEPHLYLP